jgi:hypothetical protein
MATTGPEGHGLGSPPPDLGTRPRALPPMGHQPDCPDVIGYTARRNTEGGASCIGAAGHSPAKVTQRLTADTAASGSPITQATAEHNDLPSSECPPDHPDAVRSLAGRNKGGGAGCIGAGGHSPGGATHCVPPDASAPPPPPAPHLSAHQTKRRRPTPTPSRDSPFSPLRASSSPCRDSAGARTAPRRAGAGCACPCCRAWPGRNSPAASAGNPDGRSCR